MTDLRKAAEMALKLLENNRLRTDEHLIPIVVDDLRNALAQPEQDHGFDRTASHMAGEYVDTNWDTSDMAHRAGGLSMDQEPVAWLEYDDEGYLFLSGKRKGAFPVFTAPPSKPWASLTDEEIWEWFESNTAITRNGALRIARAIEAKLKENNGFV